MDRYLLCRFHFLVATEALTTSRMCAKENVLCIVRLTVANSRDNWAALFIVEHPLFDSDVLHRRSPCILSKCEKS